MNKRRSLKIIDLPSTPFPLFPVLASYDKTIGSPTRLDAKATPS